MKKTSVLLAALILIANGNGFAKGIVRDTKDPKLADQVSKSSIESENNSGYLPYIELSGAKFFNLGKSSSLS